MKNNFTKTAYKISLLSIVINLFLSAVKFIAGLLAKSSALISDAVHSASDILSNFIVLIGIKMAAADADLDHPYGHERREYTAAIVLSLVLAVTGVTIGYNAILNIINKNFIKASSFTYLALGVAAFAIIIKEFMYWFTRHYAKKFNSGALMADAWHHQSDVFASIGSFIGILGAILGVAILDSVAGIVISLLIIKAAFGIFKDAINKLEDKACDAKTADALKSCILSVQGVLNLDEFKARMFGAKICVDVEISCDGKLSLLDAHDIASIVHDKIEQEFENVKHCMVHVNPI